MATNITRMSQHIKLQHASLVKLGSSGIAAGVAAAEPTNSELDPESEACGVPELTGTPQQTSEPMVETGGEDIGNYQDDWSIACLGVCYVFCTVLSFTFLTGQPLELEATSAAEPDAGQSGDGHLGAGQVTRKRLHSSIMDFVDRPFSAAEVQRARRAQAFCAVMSGASYNSHRAPWFKDFVNSLRFDYVPLSVKEMHSELDDLHGLLQKDVISMIRSVGHCSLAFDQASFYSLEHKTKPAYDSWSDAHGLPVIAWAVRPALQEAYVYKLEAVQQSQSSSFLKDRIEAIVHEIEALGVRITGIVSDGAANCQKALKDVSLKVVTGWCFSHLTSLLMKDLLSAESSSGHVEDPRR